MDKAEFMRQWGVAGMPLDKIRLANAAWEAATNAERKACAQVCGDRAKAASLACDAGAYYEAEECEDAILKRSNYEVSERR